MGLQLLQVLVFACVAGQTNLDPHDLVPHGPGAWSALSCLPKTCYTHAMMFIVPGRWKVCWGTYSMPSPLSPKQPVTHKEAPSWRDVVMSGLQTSDSRPAQPCIQHHSLVVMSLFSNCQPHIDMCEGCVFCFLPHVGSACAS